MGDTEWPSKLPTNTSFPPVSIVTPTYNRRQFLPVLFQSICDQSYPLERLEWVILDDGSDSVADLIPGFRAKLNVLYIRHDGEKLSIGEKRNRIHLAARGSILVCMDDDDFYCADRVKHAVQMLQRSKKDIAGSSRNFLFFTDDKSVWETGPYFANHATFGTMAFTKAYARKHLCDVTVTHAEEIGFTNRYTEPLCQLDPYKVMLVLCHTMNTFSKHKLRLEPNPMFRKTDIKLKAFVRNAKLREFYGSIG